MAIANQIAQFGMNAGRDIQNTVRNAMVRSEDQRRYGQQQGRLDRQEKIQNSMVQAEKEKMAVDREMKYASNGYEVMSRLPPEQRPAAWRQFVETGSQQGIDMTGVPTQYDDSFLQKLAFQGGNFKAPSSKLTNFKLTANNTIAGYNPVTNAYEEVSSGDIQFKDNSPKTEVSIINEAEGKGLTEELKTLGKLRAQDLSKMREAADNAIAQDEQLSQLANIDLSTGFGIETRGAMASAINGIFGKGVGDSLLNVNLSAIQAFKGVSSRLVNSELNKAKGPQTEGDAQRAKSTLASLKNEGEANAFLIKSLQATNARVVEQAQFYENVLERDGTLKNATKEWVAYKRKTPMLSANVLDQTTGLPMFFNNFAAMAQERNPGITRAEIVNAWRELNSKGKK